MDQQNDNPWLAEEFQNGCYIDGVRHYASLWAFHHINGFGLSKVVVFGWMIDENTFNTYNERMKGLI